MDHARKPSNHTCLELELEAMRNKVWCDSPGGRERVCVAVKLVRGHALWDVGCADDTSEGLGCHKVQTLQQGTKEGANVCKSHD